MLESLQCCSPDLCQVGARAPPRRRRCWVQLDLPGVTESNAHNILPEGESSVRQELVCTGCGTVAVLFSETPQRRS